MPELETPGASSRRRPAGPGQAVPRDAYCLLKREVERAGCFAPTPWRHLGDAIFVLAAYVTGFVVLLGDPDTAIASRPWLSSPSRACAGASSPMRPATGR